MKTATLIFAFFLALTASAQKPMNEQRAIKETHIDFTREYIFFTIHGLVEIDGHVFKNDTCKCPIQFRANLDGISIIDTCTDQAYEHRSCSKPNCKIIHLEPVSVNERVGVIRNPWWVEHGNDRGIYPSENLFYHYPDGSNKMILNGDTLNFNPLKLNP